RRVVAAGKEVDAELARGVQRRFLRLTGDERVVAAVRGLDEARAAAAGAHRDAPDLPRAFREDEGLAAGRLVQPARELVDRERLGEVRAGADLGEPTVVDRADPLHEERVVADLGMRVERE